MPDDWALKPFMFSDAILRQALVFRQCIALGCCCVDVEVMGVLPSYSTHLSLTDGSAVGTLLSLGVSRRLCPRPGVVVRGVMMFDCSDVVV